MQLNPAEISELIKSQIDGMSTHVDIQNQGTVISVTDGICRIHGLSDVMQGEMLEFPNNTFGLALNLERDSVGAVILGDYEHITEGDTVSARAVFWKFPWVLSSLAAWSMPWVNPSMAKARSTPK